MRRKSRSKQRNRSPLALVAPADIDEAPFTGDRDLEALIEEIANGAHDENLRLLADVINARLRVLAATESLRVLTHLSIGDRVRINHHARPLYLQGRPRLSSVKSRGRSWSNSIIPREIRHWQGALPTSRA